MFRASLFWKIFGTFLALIVLTAVVAGLLATNRVHSDVERGTKTALRQKVDLLYELLVPSMPATPDAAFQERVRAIGARVKIRVTIIRADGLVLGDSSKDPAAMDDHGSRPEVIESRTAEYGERVRHSDTVGYSMMYVARAIRGDAQPPEGTPGPLVGYVRGALPLLRLQERLGDLRVTLFGASLAAILVALAVAFVAARVLARPLISMHDVAAAFAAGDLDRRVHADTADEVGQLGRMFNHMADRLGEEMDTIRRDQRELRAILGAMIEGVLAIDRDERIVLVNDAAGAILGIDTKDARGRPLWEVLRLPQVPEVLARAVERGAVQTTTLTLHADGRERIIRLHISPLQGHDRTPRGAVLVFDDITERRRLESVRRDFIANASHELKTPVASIRGMAETILGDTGMDLSTRRGFIERILRQSHRLGDLVDEMLALSRLESQRERVDTQRLDVRRHVLLVMEDAAPLATDRDVTVHSDLGEGPMFVEGIPEAIRRIAGNLLDNAIKYSPPGGDVHVALRRSNGAVMLEVRDAGQGIPADKHDRIFERFYRVDEGRARGSGGTGLGLAIVKHLVQSLGGQIELESQPGVGSTFRVSLPRA